MRTAGHVLLRTNDRPATELSAESIKPAGSAAPTPATSRASGAATVAPWGGSESSAVQPDLAAVPQPKPFAATVARLPGPRAVAATAPCSRGLGSMRIW